jgi:hydrogenase expression/formation protein HypD
LLRHGIEAELAGTIELIHGPGCPVCVTPLEAIDFAQQLAMRDNVVLTSFGDMLRVPGSRSSLLDTKAAGGRVRIVYSPLDAVELAKRNPQDQVVFFAVGFETTAPATALAVKQAARDNVDNFSLIVAHVRVLPAMEALAQSPDNRVQAFLAAGHVCTITGFEAYEPFAEHHKLPVVVTGFEPLDLIDGILACVRQLESGVALVENQYARSVRRSGNKSAQDIVRQVYKVADQVWRGFGVVPKGGLQLRDCYQSFDARLRFGAMTQLPVIETNQCRSADVLSGRIKPPECAEFGTTCQPESPLGAPMVSSEGACAAYYRYRTLQKT